MPCFSPIRGWQHWQSNVHGTHPLTFDRRKSNGNRMSVPCGQCIGCRIDRSREWAIRIKHEASFHQENSFITLTYAPEHLPYDGSLRPGDFQRFMKRLRKELDPKKIRFFHCGEYGDRLSRPHYHAVIFGHAFDDRHPVGTGPSGTVYSSPQLARVWGKGFVTVGDVTFESAAYVARYVTKKVNGKQKDQHYEVVNTQTGEIHPVHPEYATMSRRPGIAKEWFEQYASDVYPHDFVVHKGRKVRTPRYYDRLLAQADPDLFGEVKRSRPEKAKRHKEDLTDERLAERKEVFERKIQTLKRAYDHGDTENFQRL